MQYDIFVSYSRKDNSKGLISEIVKNLKSDFKIFAGRELNPFFDISEINGMEDWRHKILKGIRESRLLLACLSPSYLISKYCEWEFNEYLKHEIGHGYFGEGVAPVYFIEVTGWEDKDFEKNSADWVTQLRRYQHFDFRPWFNEGEKSLRNVSVQERMRKLNLQIKSRIEKAEIFVKRKGNVDSHNPHFIGRTIELRRLREALAYGQTGTINIIHGLGGVGKTALAVEYSQAYYSEYGGGCWQVRCEGRADLLATIAELSAPMRIAFNEEEQKDINYQFQRVIAELHKLSMENTPNRCLLFLDNVDNPNLLNPNQTQRLPNAEWLHIIATSRFGIVEFGVGINKVFIPVDELSESDALSLIESYLPGGNFSNNKEFEAAKEIVNLLGCFTLAIEVVAVYLGEFAMDVSCREFLIRLKKEGLSGVNHIANETNNRVLHDETSIFATFKQTFNHLSEIDRTVLLNAAQLPPDHIPLKWVKNVIAETNSDFSMPVQPGYPDPWKNLIRRLISLRLLQITSPVIKSEDIEIVKMHRIVQEVVLNLSLNKPIEFMESKLRLGSQIILQSIEINSTTYNVERIWELDSLYKAILLWLKKGIYIMQRAATFCCSALRSYGLYSSALNLAEAAISSYHKNPDKETSIVWFHNMAGTSALYLSKISSAEKHFLSAQELLNNSSSSLDRFDTFSNIGSFYRESYQPELGHQPCEDALNLAKKEFTEDSQKIITANVNLGLVLQDLCRLEEAIHYLVKAVEINFGKNANVLALCQDLSTLANALRNDGRLDEAEERVNLAYKLVKENNYEKHPINVSILTNHACILEESEFYTDAQKLYVTAHELNIDCFGKQSEHLSLTLNNLGVNALFRDDFDNAKRLIQEAMDIELRKSFPNYQKLAHRSLNSAVAYMLSGNNTSADHYLKTAWNYKLQMKRHDLLSARILHVALVNSLLMQKQIDHLLGLFKMLYKEDYLTASGINIKFSLNRLIELRINNFPPELKQYWIIINTAIAAKIKNHTLKNITFLNHFKEIDLSVKI
jgi:tetratricopeptide (TPR) repeat protein